MIAGMDPNLPKVLDPKTLWKRKAETTSSKSACAWVGLLPAPPAFELEDPEPSTIDDFKIVQIPHDSNSSVLEESQRALLNVCSVKLF